MKSELDRISNNVVLRKKSDGHWKVFIPDKDMDHLDLTCEADKASTALMQFATRVRLIENREARQHPWGIVNNLSDS